MDERLEGVLVLNDDPKFAQGDCFYAALSAVLSAAVEAGLMPDKPGCLAKKLAWGKNVNEEGKQYVIKRMREFVANLVESQRIDMQAVWQAHRYNTMVVPATMNKPTAWVNAIANTIKEYDKGDDNGYYELIEELKKQIQIPTTFADGFEVALIQTWLRHYEIELLTFSPDTISSVESLIKQIDKGVDKANYSILCLFNDDIHYWWVTWRLTRL